MSFTYKPQWQVFLPLGNNEFRQSTLNNMTTATMAQGYASQHPGAITLREGCVVTAHDLLVRIANGETVSQEEAKQWLTYATPSVTQSEARPPGVRYGNPAPLVGAASAVLPDAHAEYKKALAGDYAAEYALSVMAACVTGALHPKLGNDYTPYVQTYETDRHIAHLYMATLYGMPDSTARNLTRISDGRPRTSAPAQHTEVDSGDPPRCA